MCFEIKPFNLLSSFVIQADIESVHMVTVFSDQFLMAIFRSLERSCLTYNFFKCSLLTTFSVC